MGILDFDGKTENPHFAFNYTLSMSNIDSLNFEILDEDENIIYQITSLPEVVVTARENQLFISELKNNSPKKAEPNFTTSWNWKEIINPFFIPISDYTRIGSYVILWDGFDNDAIYDSTRFDNKKLKARLTAVKGSIQKIEELTFSTNRTEVNWVDVRIDKNTKRIDATLRVNLTDGGEKGLSSYIKPISQTYPATEYRTAYDWEKVPKGEIIKYGKEPIKSRTRSFEDLEKLAIEGLDYHWGRNKNHFVAKDVKISDESFEFYMNAINSKEKSMNPIKLIYNTNNNWNRSGNPGVLAKLSYNVGYIKYSNNWGYQDDFYEIIDFKETAAHEIGHPILVAYGNINYSWEHKGSSYLFPQDIKPTIDNIKSKIIEENLSHIYTIELSGEYYPKNGEIDLMKYYNSKDPNGKKIAAPDTKRVIVAEKDVLGLIWLTKIKL